MDAAAIGCTEKEDREQSMHGRNILNFVALFLAALTPYLYCRSFCVWS
jgi:hypothetical protein